MSDFDRNLAVIIGINAYGNGIPSLTTAANDAQELARLLQDKHQYHQVWVFLDDSATRSNLEELLQKTLPNTVQANDRLVFYFAGHGIALPGEDGPQGYLIPQNAELGDITTYLPMPEVEKALTQLSCRHCLVILDCCFAGAFRWASTRDIGAVPEVIHKQRFDRFIADPAWQVITSSAYDQKALDALTLVGDSDRGQLVGQHSPFAAALIEALSGKADAYPPAQEDRPAGDGIITATELYLYLRDRIEPETEKLNKRQTPGLWCLTKHDKGEYIFLTQNFNCKNLEDAPCADKEYEDLVKEDPAYDRTIRHVMLRMVTVGGELARRRFYDSESQYPEPKHGRVQNVISRFQNALLLVRNQNDEGLPYVEPAHDVLVTG